MKIKLLLVCFLPMLSCLAQVPYRAASIAESEMKANSKTMNIASNPNTANYDMTYQKLEFTVNPLVVAPYISGKVTSTFTALSNMTTVTFDLAKALNVSSVKRDNQPLTFTQNTSNELVINLGTAVSAGTSATVEIIYAGNAPQGQEAFTRSTHSGTPIIYTLSEPFGSSDWWPCKEDLTDKVDSIDVYITAPAQFTSVSNGLEIDQTFNGSNKTTHFQHNYPIPAYLVAIAVTDYVILEEEAGTAPNTFPIINYIYPESVDFVESELEATVPIMDLFESLFQTYPYATEKYGHAQFGWGGGMEHTTVSFMGGFSRELIAHEMAHQWFGDKVTCATWQDVWLNEGFAVYLAGLVIEDQDGDSAYRSYKQSEIDYITYYSGGAVYLTPEEALNSDRIFSSRLTYSKGGMVVNMLRLKLGQEAFLLGVNNYLNDPAIAYKSATTPQLQAHLEAASGMDLTEFFNDWIYNQGYPSYTVTAYNSAAGQVKIKINQTQSHPSVNFFEMPVPVRLRGSAGQELDVVLDNTFNGEYFTVNCPFAISSIEFDPNRDIISSENSAFLDTQKFNAITGVKLYPNPAANMLYSSLENDAEIQKATFRNALGQIVMQSNTENSWNVSALAAGVHFITIETTQGIATLKFVKQ